MKEIQLTQGLVALVDDDDFEFLDQWKWNLDSHGYAKRDIKTKDGRTCIKMHREILSLSKNDGIFVDHINNIPLDNRKHNLRKCSKSENQHNSCIRKNNTSGYKGVRLQKRTGKWTARITVNWKEIHIGTFETPELAHAAYCNAALELHGEFANFGNGCVILKDSDAGA